MQVLKINLSYENITEWNMTISSQNTLDMAVGKDNAFKLILLVHLKLSTFS